MLLALVVVISYGLYRFSDRTLRAGNVTREMSAGMYDSDSEDGAEEEPLEVVLGDPFPGQEEEDSFITSEESGDGGLDAEADSLQDAEDASGNAEADGLPDSDAEGSGENADGLQEDETEGAGEAVDGEEGLQDPDAEGAGEPAAGQAPEENMDGTEGSDGGSAQGLEGMQESTAEEDRQEFTGIDGNGAADAFSDSAGGSPDSWADQSGASGYWAEESAGASHDAFSDGGITFHDPAAGSGEQDGFSTDQWGVEEWSSETQFQNADEAGDHSAAQTGAGQDPMQGFSAGQNHAAGQDPVIENAGEESASGERQTFFTTEEENGHESPGGSSEAAGNPAEKDSAEEDQGEKNPAEEDTGTGRTLYIMSEGQEQVREGVQDGAAEDSSTEKTDDGREADRDKEENSEAAGETEAGTSSTADAGAGSSSTAKKAVEATEEAESGENKSGENKSGQEGSGDKKTDEKTSGEDSAAGSTKNGAGDQADAKSSTAQAAGEAGTDSTASAAASGSAASTADKAGEGTDDSKEAGPSRVYQGVADTLKYEGKDFTVTVSYGEEAGIPAGAYLDVHEIKENTKKYDGYREQAEAAVGTADAGAADGSALTARGRLRNQSRAGSNQSLAKADSRETTGTQADKSLAKSDSKGTTGTQTGKNPDKNGRKTTVDVPEAGVPLADPFTDADPAGNGAADDTVFTEGFSDGDAFAENAGSSDPFADAGSAGQASPEEDFTAGGPQTGEAAGQDSFTDSAAADDETSGADPFTDGNSAEKDNETSGADPFTGSGSEDKNGGAAEDSLFTDSDSKDKNGEAAEDSLFTDSDSADKNGEASGDSIFTDNDSGETNAGAGSSAGTDQTDAAKTDAVKADTTEAGGEKSDTTKTGAEGAETSGAASGGTPSAAASAAPAGTSTVKKVTQVRLFDIKIMVDGEEVQPQGPVSVQISYHDPIEYGEKEEVSTVHFEGSEETPRVLETQAEAADNTLDQVTFETEGFSVFAVVVTVIEKYILASDGHNYMITVSCDPEAGIPGDAGLEVTELDGEEYEDYLGRTALAMGAGGFDYARIFDITIVDAQGEYLQPKRPVSVEVELLDTDGGTEDFSVVHFVSNDKTEVEETEEIRTQTDGNIVSFDTTGFSAYAIVQGPSAVPAGWDQIRTMEDLDALAVRGLYIGTTSGYYLTGETAIGSQDKNTTGIVKTKPAKSYPADEAVPYYFEPVEGQEDYYYIYCLDENDARNYARNTGDANLYLTTIQDYRTAFHVQVDNSGRFRMNNGNRYWNMWNGANGNHIAAWTSANDGNNYFYLWNRTGLDGDMYGLDGKTYGLMHWTEGTTGKAMMGSAEDDHLDALALTVMARTGNDADKLFVPDDSEITQWTFEWEGQDYYSLSTVIDGVRHYLKVQSGRISLTAEKNASCRLRVVPGTGAHEGEISLRAGSTILSYSGNIDTGFKAGSAAGGSEWLRLVELSELTADYFMTYSAGKVSVSDQAVTNGSRIIVYTRVWNDTAKKYEFYAVDHDGSLVRCYESGDSIDWVGSRLNSLLWNFVEYYWEGTTDPNHYYELYNQYSEKYMAPQASEGQILSDNTIGINLNGRRDGQYYSTILAWDDAHYSYIGLRADRETGKVVTCPQAEADDFYFAIMQDIPVDDELTVVKTVDHTQHGITMKMTNFNDRQAMSTFLGSDNGYKNGNTEQKLLSTTLADNGYPTTKGGKNLSEWFGSAQEVNHLFIDSIYEGTGYYEYDSVQNFAHLDQTSNNFVVYKEIGTTDGGSGKFYTHGQFFPYNDLKAGAFSSQKNLTTALGGNLPDTDPRKNEQLHHIQNPTSPDYYLGMEVNASFTQTPDGLDDWGHDIIYEFTGDDDFWLYVDGELIIDLGGIHDALAGTVNYRTGEVVVNGKRTTLRDLFYNNYKGRGHTDREAQAYVEGIFTQNADGQYIFKDYTTHTMKIFYLERGAGASNLHMRFNLASIRSGTVELSKTLSGVDKSESVLAEFPYQIWYTRDGEEHRLTNLVAEDPMRTDDYVFYKGTKNPVTYRTSLTIGGIPYEDVFLLKPDEAAEINFPDGMTEYRIVECGVDTDVYSKVEANGEELEGRSGDGYAANRKDFGLENATTADRARVAYTNEVDPDALRNLTIKKKLFKEDGVTEITADQDSTEFSFRLSLGTEFADAPAPAGMHKYRVRDASGSYCVWDPAGQKFTPVGKTSYDDLTEEEKASTVFATSPNGSISRIPTGYTVEIRHVLAGTQFGVVERPAEIPDGYSFQKYEYNGEGYSGNTADAMTGVTDTVSAAANPHVDVCNLKGWGLRVNKSWTDADYMADRAPTYFAVFTGTAEDSLTLVPDTVRRLNYGEKTLYWYFPHLPVNVPFDQYEIREVTLSNSDPAVSEEGLVTDPGTVTPIAPGGDLTLTGRQKGESATSPFKYTVTYDKGTVEDNTNVRVDAVTNGRPGIVIRKQNWAGKALAGAVFTLKSDEGGTIGTFTSDEEGFLTEAFLRDGAAYTLAETKTPGAFRGLETPVTLTLSGTRLTVEGVEPDYYTVETIDEKQTLTLKNRPLTFKAVKQDGASSEPLQGVTFALHKQHTVDGVTQISPTPMVGYEALVTGADGAIPGIDTTLAAGTYELREKETLEGYRLLPAYIRITISETGMITLGDHPDHVSLLEETDEDGTYRYTLEILNYQSKKVSFKKVDISDTSGSGLEGAVFDLYRLETADGKEERQEPALYTGLTSGPDGLLRDATQNSVFELLTGRYHLVETKAPENYQIKTTPVVITVTARDVTYDEGTTLSMSGAGKTKDETTEVYTLRISNSTGYALPATGGPGTTRALLYGAALAAIALILLLLRSESLGT